MLTTEDIQASRPSNRSSTARRMSRSSIMSETELVAALDYAKHEMDGEAGHVEADGLLAGFVSALGFHDIANAYACDDRRY